jgi:yecA family protein
MAKKKNDMQAPLTGEELRELDAFLSGRGGVSTAYARGFLSGVVSHPEDVRPAAWLPALVGDESAFADDTMVEATLNLILRFYNQTITDLDAGEAVVPADEDGLRSWCEGYVAALDLDDRWHDAGVAAAPLLPILRLGDPELDPEYQGTGTPEEIRDGCLDAYEEFKTFRLIREEERARLRSLGRNDPCPCGSGRKYKKCCLGKPLPPHSPRGA